MDGLECRGDTALPTAILLLAGALALPAALLGIAAGQPKSLLALIAPLAAEYLKLCLSNKGRQRRCAACPILLPCRGFFSASAPLPAKSAAQKNREIAQ